VNPSMQEVWSKNFQKLKTLYGNGNLTFPRADPEYLLKTVKLAILYQRHRSKSLRKDHLELLESINYKSASSMTRQSRNAPMPPRKLERHSAGASQIPSIETVHDETVLDDKVKIKDNVLSIWFWKQKCLVRSGKLDPSRQERLKKLGINLSCNCRKVNKSKKFDEQW
jgi:hypothetical protein